MNNKNIRKSFMPYIIMIGLLTLIFWFFIQKSSVVNKLTYDTFFEIVNKDELKEITITPNVDNAVYVITGTLDSYKENETFTVTLPYSDEILSKIMESQTEDNFKVVTKKDPNTNMILLGIMNFLPLILVLIVTFFIFSKMSSGGNKSFDFGKSKAKLSDDKNKICFKDVAGLVEEKEEVSELIDFLKNPKKFQKMGARIPKGVLLVGPPGTGKTLLAKSVAGEANVPFYFISGSDFVELFVGVGASRVRDMFKQAKMSAPCLIFIDEIDAVGRQRGSGIGGGHDEREQTLNQLLTEMDGFGANEGIIIMAATNRDDVLDPALLRPGRFDRKVIVSLPDVKEREAILKVHAKNKKLANDVNLKFIAKRTQSFSGAAIENLLNEAALLAVRRNKLEITMDEIDEGYDRVLMGPAKITHKYTEHERKVVAYHEAGHAVTGLKLKSADEVHKVTIIPRGNTGGYNLFLPKEEKYFSTKNELLENIVGLLGGRATEEIIFKEITNGAHNDIERSTKIARRMVTEYGMSSLGIVQYEHRDGSVFLGRDYNKSRNFSDTVAHEIDTEVKNIVDECYKKSKKVISQNLGLLELIANALLENETLTKEQIDNLVEFGTIGGKVDKVIKEETSKKEVSKVKKETKKTNKKEE
ncbi:MAG: ATP-dependent zinc metalloprotease FtsH [Bacilli bacterium]